MTYPSRIEPLVELGEIYSLVAPSTPTWLLAERRDGTGPGPVTSIAPTYRLNRRGQKLLAPRIKLLTRGGRLRYNRTTLKNSSYVSVVCPRSLNSSLTENWII